MGTARSVDAMPATVTKSTGSPVIQFPQTRPTRVAGTSGQGTGNRSTDTTRSARPSMGERAPQDVTDMEIPTFIRRQMD
jgi:hypothetical protein